ncbi:MAG: hypothetical protein Q4B78_02600, partial [Bacillota bacterium]|nr:hypothetical protein [Bacillota bacterium]
SEVKSNLNLVAKWSPKKIPTEYKVRFNVVNKLTEESVEGYKLELTYEEEADEETWWLDSETVTVEPKNSVYTLDPKIEYTYKVTCDGYKPLEGKFKPSGYEAEYTETLEMSPISDDYRKANAVKEQVEKDYVKGMKKLLPEYGTDESLTELLQGKIKEYNNLDTEGVTVEIASTDDNYETIAKDGKINYPKDALPKAYANWGYRNVRVHFTIKCGSEEVTTGEITTQVGWDRDYFNANIEKEVANLNADLIKGENESIDSVETDLDLPQSITVDGAVSGNSMMKQWSVIQWTSDNEDVIKIKKPSTDSPIYHATGVVTRSKEDQKVKLIATFVANDILMNERLDKPADFKTITKEFEITVKGDPTIKTESDIIQENLEKNYEGLLTNFYDKKTKVDTNAVTDNIQMPKPGDLEKDEVNILTDRDNQIVVMK